MFYFLFIIILLSSTFSVNEDFLAMLLQPSVCCLLLESGQFLCSAVSSVHCPVHVIAPNTSSRPIIFCVDADPTFEGNFVLATLADDVTPETNGSQQQQQQQQSQQQQSQRCDVSMATTSGVEKTR